MNLIGIFGGILIFSAVLLLGNCIADGTDSQSVSIQMDVPVSIGFNTAPNPSLTLNGIKTGDSTYLNASTYVDFYSNNADGYNLAATMDDGSGGHLKTDYGTELKAPLEISLPDPENPHPAYQSLAAGAIWGYDPGRYWGNIKFSQLVDLTKEGGTFSGDVTIALSLPYSDEI